MRHLASTLQTLGIAFAFGMLGVLAWQGKNTQDALVQANVSVNRSLELISAVRGTVSALQDIETGMRGFALTGEPAFLAPYHGGLQRLAVERRALAHGLEAEPDAAARLGELDRAIARRVELAAGNVEFRRSGTLEATALRVRDAGGKEAMDRVRLLLDAIERRERADLDREHAAVAQQLARGRTQALAGAACAILLLLVALVSIHRNLRLRMRLAARAQAGEARQRAMLRAIPDTLWQVDAAGAMQSLSAEVDRAAPLPEGLRAAIVEHLPRAAPDAGVQTFPWADADGHEYEVRLVAAGDGDRLAIVRDVTESVRNRRDLIDRRAFLRSIVDTDENLIFVRDHEGRFVLCNLAFCDALHADPADVEGAHPEALAAHAVVTPLFDGDDVLASGESEWRHEQVRIVDANGTERWLQVLKRPLELASGRRQVLTVAVDISARLQAERLKNEFVSTVSHELRTPLTSIRGALGMLSSGMAGELPDATRPLLDIAHKNTERLVRLINDILDIEKLESGRLQLQLRAMPVRPLVEQAIEQNLTYAREFGVALVLSPGDDGEVSVDPDRFAQVMANLLSNAIKHSPAGGRVGIAIGTRHGGVRIDVADHGDGIPEAFRPRVFERFAQADASDVRRRGGSGLGLAITRSLVEQMHGTIGFDTATGEGTTFYVWLPRANDTPAMAPPAANPARPQLVLLGDDDAVSSELAHAFAGHGFDARIAVDAAQARQLLDDNAAHALLIDLALPGEAGPAFVRELREQPRFRHLPVLMLGVQPPAGGNEGVRGGTVGVVDWLGKPVDPQQVASAVRACLRGRRERPDVLHVEDDADLRALVRGLLASQPLTLHEAPDLATARAELAARHHDLVILDLMLPDGDGTELLPELGAAQPPTPVIIFSAQDSALPESRIVMRRLVKSRSGAAELAALVMHNLKHWPSANGRPEEAP